MDIFSFSFFWYLKGKKLKYRFFEDDNEEVLCVSRSDRGTDRHEFFR